MDIKEPRKSIAILKQVNVIIKWKSKQLGQDEKIVPLSFKNDEGKEAKLFCPLILAIKSAKFVMSLKKSVNKR